MTKKLDADSASKQVTEALQPVNDFRGFSTGSACEEAASRRSRTGVGANRTVNLQLGQRS